MVEVKAPVTKLLPKHPKPEYIPQMLTQAKCYSQVYIITARISNHYNVFNYQENRRFNNSYSQFNQGRALPDIMHVVYTPAFIRIWTYKVEEELMDEFLDLAHELYFDPDVSWTKVATLEKPRT